MAFRRRGPYIGAFKNRRSFAFNRTFGRPAKPAMLTVNHCIITPFTTVSFVENQQAIFTTEEPPTNRGSMIPSGALLKGIDIQLWGTDGADNATVGLHRCMMMFRPASTVYGTPIASWLSTADPLTEEAIQIRQNVLQRMHQYVNVDNTVKSAYWRCSWRGNKSLRQGDAIVVVIEDETVTNWIGLCNAWWIN